MGVAILESKRRLRLATAQSAVRIGAISCRVGRGRVNCVEISRFSAMACSRFGRTLSSLRGRKVRNLVISLEGGPKKDLSAIAGVLHLLLPRNAVMSAGSGGKGASRVAYSKARRFGGPVTILMGRCDTDTSRVFDNTMRSCKATGVIKIAACKGNIIRRLVSLKSKAYLGIAVTRCCAPGKEDVGKGNIRPSIRIRCRCSRRGPGTSGRLSRTLDAIRKRVDRDARGQ